MIAHLAAKGRCSVALFATLPLAIETHASAVAEKSVAAVRAVFPAIQLHDHESASCDRTNANLSMEELLAMSVSAAIKYTSHLIGATT